MEKLLERLRLVLLLANMQTIVFIDWLYDYNIFHKIIYIYECFLKKHL